MNSKNFFRILRDILFTITAIILIIIEILLLISYEFIPATIDILFINAKYSFTVISWAACKFPLIILKIVIYKIKIHFLYFIFILKLWTEFILILTNYTKIKSIIK